jgi:GAF domain-containing protein
MDMQIEAIASTTGMSGIFKLQAADTCRVVSVERLPYPAGLARKTARLARQIREFRILQRVSAEVNSTLNLEAIYDIALRTSGRALRVSSRDQSCSSSLAARHFGSWQAEATRIRRSADARGSARASSVVARKRKMLHVNNLGQQRAYAAAQRRQMMKAGRGEELGDAVPVPGLPNAESQIAIPLLIRDDLIGVFSIESPVRYTFSEHDRGLVSIVANQVASAINNARLYEQKQRAAEALQAANGSLEARVEDRQH